MDDDVHEELIRIRRDIHAHPELGFEEHHTAAMVAAKLREWGIETVEGIGGTGVVATLRGLEPDVRAIGLRAELDALPIQEQTGAPYASTIPGKMHACGHDGHIAMLLGAARHLAEHRDFRGTVHLIFQPSEESLSGARAMLADGLFDRFPCDAIYGLHNTAGMPVGRFATREGPMLAACDLWKVTFHGTGGHGGLAPHLATDSTLVQANFIMGLQTIIGRNLPPIETGVISVGYVHGGVESASNVIPDEVVVGGTSRSYLPHVRDTIERRLHELALSIAAAYDCSAEVGYNRVGRTLVNHADQTRMAIAAASRVAGPDRVEDNLQPTTGGEDFAEMLDLCPGAFMRIGNGRADDGSFNPPHTPKFDFNDDIIPLGVAFWTGLVDEELGYTR